MLSGRIALSVTAMISLGLMLCVVSTAIPGAAPDGPVRISEDAASFTLSNEMVTIRVAKSNGDLQSLVYKGIETLTDRSGHPGGYWSHDAGGGVNHQTAITIDPRTNGGARGEVSVKAVSGGRRLGRPAGLAAGAEGDFAADIEIRYAVGRGESGAYTYSILKHRPEYPAGSIGEARYCAKLAETYDWLSVDPKRNKYYPHEEAGEDKYVYTAVQSQNLAYGWSSTRQKIGWWLINPTIEYLSGGPTKVEFLCHRDTTQVQAPCVLNYWRSSHYGGAAVDVAEGESWTKVIGPFYLYMNSGKDPMDLWKDALAQAKVQAARWPFNWVEGVDYAKTSQRATVSGRFLLTDPQAPDAKLPNLHVGLTHEAWASPTAAGRIVDWQRDAKFYEFWAMGKEDGAFAIPNVRAGSYVLRAFADGVLGEFARAEVNVEDGKSLNVGTIVWTPVRKGRQLWDIGIPNRNGSEFFKAEDFAVPDIALQYPKLFPGDVIYTIGKSDFHKDWFFAHIPHNVDPDARIAPFQGIQGRPGNASPWTVSFELPGTPKGQATLRAAISGSGTVPRIEVMVNDQPAGAIARPPGDGAITRHQIQGIWVEREVPFPASLMKKGTNTLKLIVPGGNITNGVIYDYLRLELDESL
jgi:rhamnogalacturonan endolyase